MIAPCWLGCLLLILIAKTPAADSPITALAFAPRETELLAGSQQGVQRFSWPGLKPTGKLATDLIQVHDIRFSPDGKLIAIAGGTPGEAGVLEVWAWPELERRGSHAIHRDVIYQIAWSASSKRLFTASHDRDVLEVSLPAGEVVRRFSGHSQPVRSVCLLENQETLVTAGNDETIRVWNIQTGEVVRSLTNHTKAVLGLAVRPPPESDALPVIASFGADGTVRLWQPTIGRMMRFLRLPSNPTTVAWSPRGDLLVTLGTGELQVLDTDTLEVQSTQRLEAHRPTAIAITTGGKSVVVGGEKGTLQKIDPPAAEGGPALNP